MSAAVTTAPESRSAAGILLENVRGVLKSRAPSGAPRIDLPPLTQAKLAIHDTPRVFTEWSRQGERLIQLQLGPLRAFLATHPEDAKAVLQDNHRSFAKNTPAFSKMRLVFGNGLVTSQGPFWLRQRRLIQPSFAKDRLSIYAHHMTPAIARMEATLPSGHEVDVMEAMSGLALELVMTTLLGSQSPSETAEISESLTWLMHDIEARAGQYIDIPLAVPTPRNRIHRRHATRLIDLVDGVIERKRREGGGDDLVSRLLESRDPETGASMNEHQVRDEVLTMFIAGHETTANGLSWAMGLLAADPEIQAKLHEELDGLGRAAEPEDLRGLGYLTSVVSETLRLYPPAWVTDRSAEEDVMIGAVKVPKGSVVYVCPYVTHRRPDVWTSPDSFQPDRFAPEKRKALPRFAYYPFGGGPRKCVGANFALIEMSLVLARLVRRFTLHPTGPMPGLDPRITLRPKHGLRVKMTRRDVC